MIYHMTYMYMNEQQNVAGLTGGFSTDKQPLLNSWAAVKTLMEGTADHLVWIVQINQLTGILAKFKQYDLDKYLVVDRRELGKQGTSNRNYPDTPRRLHLFIMKGAKNEVEARTV